MVWVVLHVNGVQVSCVMDCYNAIATEHGLLKSKLCRGIVLLLNVADILFVLVFSQRSFFCDWKSDRTRIVM